MTETYSLLELMARDDDAARIERLAAKIVSDARMLYPAFYGEAYRRHTDTIIAVADAAEIAARVACERALRLNV